MYMCGCSSTHIHLSVSMFGLERILIKFAINIIQYGAMLKLVL
jgi:hypothetical protein